MGVLFAPLNGGEPKEVHIVLEGLPQREEWTTRLRVKASMLSRTEFCMKVEDMGFGELFPSSGAEWEKIMEIA